MLQSGTVMDKEKIYELRVEEEIEEIQGKGYLFHHLKSDAKVVILKNKDPHKAFSITFKTIPKDDSGLCHIMEHSVCCSSKKYPLKDTFMTFDKKSVNTAFNACTYKDMTMFYGATLYEKDLLNMIDVYMDLVFHPLIEDKPDIFKQEGWHYKLTNKNAPLQYNGIVYNEMQGEYAQANTWLEYEMHRMLFKDTCYQYDSGGVPKYIPELTEASFLDFHKRYYTPSNAVLYLYGDIDVEKMLDILHSNYLNVLKKGEQPEKIVKQQPPQSPYCLQKVYPVLPDEEEEKILMGLSFVVGEAVDTKLRLTFQMLEHMLLKSAASPLNRALIEEAKLGKVLNDSGYDMGKYQPTFSIVLSDCLVDKQKAFEAIVFETLTMLVEEGIPKDLVDAAINTVAFGLYEGDGGGEPKGILYGEDVLMSLLYEHHPFSHLSYKQHLKSIEEAKATGYFEQIIKTYFLENKHYVNLVLSPSKTFYESEVKEQKEKLKKLKNTFTKKDIKQLIKYQQMTEDRMDEAHESILPVLSKSDLDEVSKPVHYKVEKEDVTYLWHEEATKGISYIHLLFDATIIPEEDLHYIGLLAHILTYLSTENMHFETLENCINKETGGLNCSINAFSQAYDSNMYHPYFKISAKLFSDKIEVVVALLREILTQSIFVEEDKLMDLIQLIQYDYEHSFISTPEYRATRRCYTYFSKAGAYEDRVSGWSFYGFLTSLCKKELGISQVASKLQDVYEKLMRNKGLIISITTESQYKDKIKQAFNSLTKALSNKELTKYQYRLESTVTNEAIIIGSQVQAVVKGYVLPIDKGTFKGSMYVVNHLMNTNYLWEEVRLKGGAYGADLTLTRDGNVMLVSYCDPNLIETLECFEKVGSYLSTISLTEKELESYIVATLGGMDYPVSIEEKSEQVYLKYLSGLTDTCLEREREEVKATTVDEIRSIGKWFMNPKSFLCVIGNGEKIKKHARLFQHIRRMS